MHGKLCYKSSILKTKNRTVILLFARYRTDLLICCAIHSNYYGTVQNVLKIGYNLKTTCGSELPDQCDKIMNV